MTKNRLDKFTAFIGWALWLGFYLLGIAAFLVTVDSIKPLTTWSPWTWSFGTWLMAFSMALISSVGYTLLMLLAVYGIKSLIRRWLKKEHELRAATEGDETKAPQPKKIEERPADVKQA